MNSSSGPDRAALAGLLRQQHQMISRAQALASGVTHDGIRHRVKPGGRWQRVLPGVYAAVTGDLTADQRDMAALLYGGPGSVLTGRAALRGLRITTARPGMIDVLIPADRRRQSTGFAVMYRTSRMPGLFVVEGQLRYAMAPRAVADSARFAASVTEARALVASAVQRGACPVGLLSDELAAGPKPRSAMLRRALLEVAEGVRSVAEGDFRELILAARLPRPEFNARLRLGGRVVAVADVLWRDARLVGEVDSREWHLSPADWERTMRRHNELTSRGFQVLHFSPRQIRTEPRAVVAAIAGALAQRVNRAEAG